MFSVCSEASSPSKAWFAQTYMKGIVATQIVFSQTRKKDPAVFAGAQKTVFVVVLGLLTPKENLQTYITGIVAIEILFSQTRIKDRAVERSTREKAERNILPCLGIGPGKSRTAKSLIV